MKLFEHQKSGIDFLKKKGKAILADEMGLGKTRQAIIAAQETRKFGEGVLIVCPASLKINWQREIKEVYPDAYIEIIHPKWQFAPSTPEWMIINYDIIEKKLDVLEWMIDGGIIGTLILDESNYIKGKSIRANAIVGGRVKKKNGEILKFEGLASKINQVYCLTGTPLLNRPIELFNQLTAIGHPLGGHGKRSSFARRFCGAFLRTIYVKGGYPIRIFDESGSSNLDELREHLKGWIIRRKKKDVIDLPDKIVTVMECDMSREAKKEYDSAWDMYLQFIADNPMPERDIDNILMARHLVEIGKLKQVCSRSKIERIVSDVRNAVEQGEKIIIFSQYTRTIEWIANLLRAGVKGCDRIRCVTLTGADDMDERQKAVDAFQTDESVKVFVANIKAGGVGLNLTEGNIVMFADMDWSPETHRQAEDRAHRIGQKEMVNVYYYVAIGTIEEDIVRILNEKKNVMDQILEGDQNRISQKDSAQGAFLRLMAKKQAVHNSAC
jgi:SNF2 family DNA or RNA helicase